MHSWRPTPNEFTLARIEVSNTRVRRLRTCYRELLVSQKLIGVSKGQQTQDKASRWTRLRTAEVGFSSFSTHSFTKQTLNHPTDVPYPDVTARVILPESFYHIGGKCLLFFWSLYSFSLTNTLKTLVVHLVVQLPIEIR